MTKYAIVGAEESVGHEILSFMEEDGIKASNVFAVDVNAPLGTQVSYGEDAELDVHNLETFDFSQVNAAVFATTAEVAKRFIPKAVKAGVKVVDATGATFEDSDVPMIISGVNEAEIKKASKGLVSIPSAAVTRMLIPLKAVHDKYKIKRLVVNCYVSTSIYGKEAMDELFDQTRKIFMNESLVDNQKVFNKQIAFNIIPQAGEFIGDETSFEWAMNAETKKVLGPNIRVHANFAVIPAFIGTAQYVNVECAEEIDADEARKLMKSTKGVVVFDKKVDGGYVSLVDVQGEDDIYVSRVRQDVSVDNGISFWCVADNLHVGMAKNAYAVMHDLLKSAEEK